MLYFFFMLVLCIDIKQTHTRSMSSFIQGNRQMHMTAAQTNGNNVVSERACIRI